MLRPRHEALPGCTTDRRSRLVAALVLVPLVLHATDERVCGVGTEGRAETPHGGVLDCVHGAAAEVVLSEDGQSAVCNDSTQRWRSQRRM